MYPRCKTDMKQIYISTEGYVMPCCWIGNEPHMRDYRQYHKDHLEELNVKNRPLDQILNDPRYRKVEMSWSTDKPFNVCQEYCSKAPPPQSEKMQGTNTARRISLGQLEEEPQSAFGAASEISPEAMSDSENKNATAEISGWRGWIHHIRNFWFKILGRN